MRNDWQISLKADPTSWLLEPDNPSVRYFTLIDLLGRSVNDPEVRDARAGIASSPIVLSICADQRSDGAWMGPDFYTPKGLATFWRVGLLGEIGLTIRDKCEVVRAACEFMFRHQARDGCFQRINRHSGKRPPARTEIPCIQARIVRALIQLGYGDDPRTKRAIGWLVRTQRDDGAWLCSGANPRYGCLRATIDYLRAMELFPAMKKNPATQRAVNFIGSLLMQPRMGRFHVSEAWTVFEFPYFNYSLIPTLLALLRLGLPSDHPTIAPVIQYLIERQRDDGTWTLDNARRAPADFGRVGERNKWLTLDAMRVIRSSVEST